MKVFYHLGILDKSNVGLTQIGDLKMTEQHTYLFTVGGVAFYEHGEYGDEHSLLAKINGEFVVTDFWDRPDSYEVADWLEND